MNPLEQGSAEIINKKPSLKPAFKGHEQQGSFTSFTYCLDNYNSLQKFYSSKNQPHIFESPEGTKEESITFAPERITFSRSRNIIFTKSSNLSLSQSVQTVKTPIHKVQSRQLKGKQQFQKSSSQGRVEVFHEQEDEHPEKPDFESYFSSVFDKQIGVKSSSNPSINDHTKSMNIQSEGQPHPKNVPILSTPVHRGIRPIPQNEEYSEFEPFGKKIKLTSEVREDSYRQLLTPENDENTPRKLSAKAKRQQISSRFQSPQIKIDPSSKESTLFKELMQKELAEVFDQMSISVKEFVKEYLQKPIPPDDPHDYCKKEPIVKEERFKEEELQRGSHLMELGQFFDCHRQGLDPLKISGDELIFHDRDHSLGEQSRVHIPNTFYNDDIFKSHEEGEQHFDDFLCN